MSVCLARSNAAISESRREPESGELVLSGTCMFHDLEVRVFRRAGVHGTVLEILDESVRSLLSRLANRKIPNTVQIRGAPSFDRLLAAIEVLPEST